MQMLLVAGLQALLTRNIHACIKSVVTSNDVNKSRMDSVVTSNDVNTFNICIFKNEIAKIKEKCKRRHYLW